MQQYDTISAGIGAGYAEAKCFMQLAQGYHHNANLALVLYLHLVAASRAPVVVPKMVLTLCNLHWWCSSIN